MRSILHLTAAGLMSCVLAGCGGGGGNGGDSGEPGAAPEPAPAPEATTSGDGGAEAATTQAQAAGPEKWAQAGPSEVVTREGGTPVVHITGDDDMKYNVKEFTVPAETKIKLILYHVGKQPRSAMGHNVTILDTGMDPLSFASKATGEGGNLENGYLPEKLRDSVVATTKMIGGGKRTSIEFETPKAGDYPYVCTFPAHAVSGMRGTMHVVAGD